MPEGNAKVTYLLEDYLEDEVSLDLTLNALFENAAEEPTTEEEEAMTA